MEEIQQNLQKPKLVQKLGTYNYKLFIPTKVEQKIRFICQKIWNTEWSGTLFFTYEGSFEDNNLVIKCEDIYVMDIGTQAYTEFDMNPDVIAYMTEHPELLDCQMGLIHSHNNMATFLSGTDTATLREEGIDRNNFVSLIVNNEGTYTAAITRNIKSKQVKESISYELFGEGEKHDTKEYVSNEDEIEWFYLKVEKEKENYSFSDTADRLEEIRKKKAEMAKKQTFQFSSKKSATVLSPYGAKEKSTDNTFVKNNTVKYPLFDDIDDPLFEDNYDMPYGIVKVDKTILKSLVLQLITGSVTLSSDSKIDIIKWVKSMPMIYEKRFGKGIKGMENFKIWADVYTEYLVWNVSDTKLEEEGLDETEICAICAHDIIEELNKLPKNNYIKEYIEALQKYLIL